MITILFFALLALFALIYFFIGKKVASSMNNEEDYFLSKKSLGIFSLSLTLLATQLGGGALLGASDAAYEQGWIVIFYPLGMCLGLVALALGFGSRLKNLGLKTVAEIFYKVYGSKPLQKSVSVLSILTLFFILVAQGIAARKFFLSIGFDGTYIFLGFWAIVMSYTVVGGLRGVVNTDIVKTIFIIATFILVFSMHKVEPSIGLTNINIYKFSKNVPWIAWLAMPLLFMVIEQDMGQRCFAAKNSKVVKKAGIIAAIFLMLASCFAIYFGVLAKRLGLVISPEKGVLMSSILATTGPYVATIFACSVLMVIISTADSLLCSIASNVALDFSFLDKKSPRSRLVISQIITLSVGILAMVTSYLFTNVLALLIFSYEISVNILFVPISMAIFSKNVSKNAAITSMAIGFVAFLSFKVWTPPIPKEILTLLLSYTGFFMVEKLSKRAAKKLEVE